MAMLRKQHVSDESLKTRCNYVNSLPFPEKCDFIYKRNCDSEAHLIKYHELLYCMIPADAQHLYYCVVTLMFLFCILLFFYLGVTVDQFFCPAIGVLSDILRLSENISGVTLLALGNGLPDIITSLISSSSGETVLMYNQLLGSSMFVTCFIAGLVAVVRPFHFEVFPYIRDMIFMIITVTFIVCISNKTIYKYTICAFFGIYVCYLTIAFGYFFYETKNAKRNKRRRKVDWTELRRSCIVNENDVRQIILELRKKYANLDSDEAEPATESHFVEFWNDIKAFSIEEWRLMNCCGRFSIIVQIPLLVALKLIIPNVSFGSPRNGWCKSLNTLNVILFPVFIGISFDLNVKVYGINIKYILLIVGLVCGFIVWMTSKKEIQPRYHIIFAFLNLAGSIIVIYKLVGEIVSILNLFGTILSIESQILWITLLGWGNGLGDAVTNISLAKRGFQRMAFSGCLAGSLTTMCLSFGLSLIATKEETIPIQSGSMGPVCSLFIMVNLIFSLLFMLLTNFKARKSYGLFLVFVYAEFLIFCFLIQLNVIHPLGSDQETGQIIK